MTQDPWIREAVERALDVVRQSKPEMFTDQELDEWIAAKGDALYDDPLVIRTAQRIRRDTARTMRRGINAYLSVVPEALGAARDDDDDVVWALDTADVMQLGGGDLRALVRIYDTLLTYLRQTYSELDVDKVGDEIARETRQKTYAQWVVEQENIRTPLQEAVELGRRIKAYDMAVAEGTPQSLREARYRWQELPAGLIGWRRRHTDQGQHPGSVEGVTEALESPAAEERDAVARFLAAFDTTGALAGDFEDGKMPDAIAHAPASLSDPHDIATWYEDVLPEFTVDVFLDHFPDENTGLSAFDQLFARKKAATGKRYTLKDGDWPMRWCLDGLDGDLLVPAERYYYGNIHRRMKLSTDLAKAINDQEEPSDLDALRGAVFGEQADALSKFWQGEKISWDVKLSEQIEVTDPFIPLDILAAWATAAVQLPLRQWTQFYPAVLKQKVRNKDEWFDVLAYESLDDDIVYRKGGTDHTRPRITRQTVAPSQLHLLAPGQYLHQFDRVRHKPEHADNREWADAVFECVDPQTLRFRIVKPTHPDITPEYPPEVHRIKTGEAWDSPAYEGTGSTVEVPSPDGEDASNPIDPFFYVTLDPAQAAHNFVGMNTDLARRTYLAKGDTFAGSVYITKVVVEKVEEWPNIDAELVQLGKGKYQPARVRFVRNGPRVEIHVEKILRTQNQVFSDLLDDLGVRDETEFLESNPQLAQTVREARAAGEADPYVGWTNARYWERVPYGAIAQRDAWKKEYQESINERTRFLLGLINNDFYTFNPRSEFQLANIRKKAHGENWANVEISKSARAVIDPVLGPKPPLTQEERDRGDSAVWTYGDIERINKEQAEIIVHNPQTGEPERDDEGNVVLRKVPSPRAAALKASIANSQDTMRQTYVQAFNQDFRAWLNSDNAILMQDRISATYSRIWKGYRSPAYSEDPLCIVRWGADQATEYTQSMCPYPFQRSGVRRLDQEHGGLLALSTGAGKTMTAAGAIALARQRGQVSRPVIVCSDSLVLNWLVELRRFFPDYRIHTIGMEKTKRQRIDRRSPQLWEAKETLAAKLYPQIQRATGASEAKAWEEARKQAQEQILAELPATLKSRPKPKTAVSKGEDPALVQEIRDFQRGKFDVAIMSKEMLDRFDVDPDFKKAYTKSSIAIQRQVLTQARKTEGDIAELISTLETQKANVDRHRPPKNDPLANLNSWDANYDKVKKAEDERKVRYAEAQQRLFKSLREAMTVTDLKVRKRGASIETLDKDFKDIIARLRDALLDPEADYLTEAVEDYVEKQTSTKRGAPDPELFAAYEAKLSGPEGYVLVDNQGRTISKTAMYAACKADPKLPRTEEFALRLMLGMHPDNAWEFEADDKGNLINDEQGDPIPLPEPVPYIFPEVTFQKGETQRYPDGKAVPKPRERVKGLQKKGAYDFDPKMDGQYEAMAGVRDAQGRLSTKRETLPPQDAAAITAAYIPTDYAAWAALFEAGVDVTYNGPVLQVQATKPITDYRTVTGRPFTKKAARATAKQFSLLPRPILQQDGVPIYWDDIGIDMLVVDEAHAYSHLLTAQKRGSQAGGQVQYLSGSASKVAWKMEYRAAVTRQKHGGRVVFLTATPAQASPLDLYNLMQMVSVGDVGEGKNPFSTYGILDAEQFITRYVAIVSGLVIKPSGDIREMLKVDRFVHMEEFKQLFERFVNYKTVDNLPALAGPLKAEGKPGEFGQRGNPGTFEAGSDIFRIPGVNVKKLDVRVGDRLRIPEGVGTGSYRIVEAPADVDGVTQIDAVRLQLPFPESAPEEGAPWSFFGPGQVPIAPPAHRVFFKMAANQQEDYDKYAHRLWDAISGKGTFTGLKGTLQALIRIALHQGLEDLYWSAASVTSDDAAAEAADLEGDDSEEGSGESITDAEKRQEDAEKAEGRNYVRALKAAYNAFNPLTPPDNEMPAFENVWNDIKESCGDVVGFWNPRTYAIADRIVGGEAGLRREGILEYPDCGHIVFEDQVGFHAFMVLTLADVYARARTALDAVRAEINAGIPFADVGATLGIQSVLERWELPWMTSKAVLRIAYHGRADAPLDEIDRYVGTLDQQPAAEHYNTPPSPDVAPHDPKHWQEIMFRIAVLNSTAAKDKDAQRAIADGFNGQWKKVADAQGKTTWECAEEPAYTVLIANKVAYEGVDLQKRTCALHHASLPWIPGEYHQKNGRAVRQGNRFDRVDIYVYLAEGTTDYYKLQRMEGRKAWIDTALEGSRDAVILGGTSDREQIEFIANAVPENLREEALRKLFEMTKRIRDRERARSMDRVTGALGTAIKASYTGHLVKAIHGPKFPLVETRRKQVASNLIDAEGLDVRQNYDWYDDILTVIRRHELAAIGVGFQPPVLEDHVYFANGNAAFWTGKMCGGVIGVLVKQGVFEYGVLDKGWQVFNVSTIQSWFANAPENTSWAWKPARNYQPKDYIELVHGYETDHRSAVRQICNTSYAVWTQKAAIARLEGAWSGHTSDTLLWLSYTADRWLEAFAGHITAWVVENAYSKPNRDDLLRLPAEIMENGEPRLFILGAKQQTWRPAILDAIKTNTHFPVTAADEARIEADRIVYEMQMNQPWVMAVKGGLRGPALARLQEEIRTMEAEARGVFEPQMPVRTAVPRILLPTRKNFARYIWLARRTWEHLPGGTTAAIDTCMIYDWFKTSGQSASVVGDFSWWEDSPRWHDSVQRMATRQQKTLQLGRKQQQERQQRREAAEAAYQEAVRKAKKEGKPIPKRPTVNIWGDTEEVPETEDLFGTPDKPKKIEEK